SSLCEKVKSVPTTIAPCRTRDATKPAGERLSPASVSLEILLLVPVVLTGRSCDIRDKAYVGETRSADERHYLHYAPVVDRFVAAHEDTLVVSICGNCVEAGHQVVFGDAGVLEVDAAVAANRERKGLAILA